MPVEPYLFFRGRCEEALEFYKDALGADVPMFMRFRDNPEQNAADCLPPGSGDKVMHACLQIGDAKLMVSDGMSQEPTNFDGFSLSLTASGPAEAERWFTALSDGGKVEMPLGKTFFAELFGGVVDRFGVSWMVIVPSDYQGPTA